jgi:hypothetical protein
MDKPEVLTGSIDTEFVDTLLTGCTAERSFVEAALADYKQKMEDELWQAWEMAQSFTFNTDRSRFLDERRVFEEQRTAFHAVVGAYNREREKEGKAEHKMPGFEKTADVEEAVVVEHECDDTCQGHSPQQERE